MLLVQPKLDKLEKTGNQANLVIRFAGDRAAAGIVKGLFLDQRINLGEKLRQVYHKITRIASVAPVYFQEEIHFRFLLSILLRAFRTGGSADCLSSEDKRDVGIFNINLLRRFLSFQAEIVGLK